MTSGKLPQSPIIFKSILLHTRSAAGLHLSGLLISSIRRTWTSLSFLFLLWFFFDVSSLLTLFLWSLKFNLIPEDKQVSPLCQTYDSLISGLTFAFFCSMGAYEEPKETCGTICLKYLLFAFNFLFWVSLCPVLWGFECISPGSRAATRFLQGFSKLFQSGRCWSAGKHWWQIRKMRWDCFIFKQVKNRNNWLIPAAFLASGITARLHASTEDTTMCSKTWSSELSSNEDVVFRERADYK